MDKYCQHHKIYNGGKRSVETSGNTSTDSLYNLRSLGAVLRNSSESSLKEKVLLRVGEETETVSKAVLCSRSPVFARMFENDTREVKENVVTVTDIKMPALKLLVSFLYTGSVEMSGNTSMDSLYNLRSLGAALRNSSESSLKEKVLLRVGEETETVSKVVLCSRSPVFARMFQNDTREVKENVVTVSDIKMPVLKLLVSFLYTGKLSNCDFDTLCDLYYASDKYDVAELRQICVDLIIRQISMKNIHSVMKLAFSHNDEMLKSTVMALIATNIETWFSTNEWINLINDEPKIAAEVLNFFNF